MILSILITTVEGREPLFNSLVESIQRQIDDGYKSKVEILSLKDNKEITIGEKRNRLYEMANGKYAVQIDDDDEVSGSFVTAVIKALKYDVDCVGYHEYGTGMGRPFRSDFSLRYKEWKSSNGNDLIGGIFKHVRTPFHKTPIRTELAQSVKFNDLRFGEDHDWAKRIYPLLHTESYINEIMYFYRYQQQDHNSKYGIK